MNWEELSEDNVPETGMMVLGYNPNWIHADFNPEGFRECFVGVREDTGEEGWISAKWNSCHDTWVNCEKDEPTHIMIITKPVTE